MIKVLTAGLQSAVPGADKAVVLSICPDSHLWLLCCPKVSQGSRRGD